MGWGDIRKAVGGVVNALPGAETISKASGSGLLGIGGLLYAPGIKASKREQNNLRAGALAAEQSAQIQAEAERQKMIAAESVRIQEEKERRRTLFGGDALGATAERKSLLGL
jgi:hypothetical protein